MATRTSSQAGDRSLNSTWGGAAPPGIGDRAVINHAVTNNSGIWTVGESLPASQTTDYAIQINGTGSLLNAAGATLRPRGHVLQSGQTGGGGNFVNNGTLIYDASAAADPTNQHYKHTIGNTGIEINARFTSAGISETERAIVTSDPAGGNAYQGTASNYNGGIHDWLHTTYSRLGFDTTPAITIGSASSANHVIRFEDVTSEESHEVFSTGIAPEVIPEFINCRWRNSLAGSLGVNITSTNVVPVGGQRKLVDCSFTDTKPKFPIWGADFSGTFFMDGWSYLQNVGRLADGGADNIFLRIYTPDQIRSGDLTDFYLCIDKNTYDGAGACVTKVDFPNPHVNTPVGAAAGVYKMTDGVVESLGSDDTGDFDYGANSADFHTEMLRVLGIPEDRDSGDPYAIGTMATLNGWNGARCKYNSCTWYMRGQGALALAEGGNGHTGMVDELRNNIFWKWSASASGNTGFDRITYLPTSINNFTGYAEGMVNELKVGHNVRFNLNMSSGTETLSGAYTDGGTLGGSYHHRDTSGVTFHTNDLTVDPQFFDKTRRMWTWVRDVLCAGTHPLTPTPDRKDWQAWGLYLLSLFNDPHHADHDPAATFASLKTYLRVGFRPTNELLRGSGHDGSDRGAVAMAAPSAGGGTVVPASFSRPGPMRRRRWVAEHVTVSLVSVL